MMQVRNPGLGGFVLSGSVKVFKLPYYAVVTVWPFGFLGWQHRCLRLGLN